MEARAREAKNDPSMLYTFLRYHLGIITVSHSEWIAAKHIRECNKDDMPNFKGERCWIGIDIGATEDLTASCRLFERGIIKKKVIIEDQIVEREEMSFGVVFDIYCTANKIDAVANNDRDVRYFEWAKNGWINIAGSTDTDYLYIRETIEKQINTENVVRNITFDRAGAWEMGVELERKYKGKGVDFLRPINFNSITASPPMKRMQFLIRNGLIQFYNNPVIEWMIGNVMVKVDSKDNIFPNKKEAKGKIDGVVACILAIDGYLNDEYKYRAAPEIIFI
jgi:phage terminase large subunit-like protein